MSNSNLTETLGQRIVLAARLAACEHLRQSFLQANAECQTTAFNSSHLLVIGGVDQGSFQRALKDEIVEAA